MGTSGGLEEVLQQDPMAKSVFRIRQSSKSLNDSSVRSSVVA